MVLRGEVGRRARASRRRRRAADPHLTQRQRRDVALPGAARRSVVQMGSRQALLDGEIVAFNAEGRPTSGCCRRACTSGKPGAALAAVLRCSYACSTCCTWKASRCSTRPTTSDARCSRARVQGEHWSVPPALRRWRAARWTPPASRVSRASSRSGAMRSTCPGGGSDCWLKVKHVRRTSAVIAGWKPGEGGRAGGSARCCWACKGPKGLEYAGHVGTGFTAATLDDARRRLEPLAP